MYCSETFTHDVNDIECLFDDRILYTFNVIKLFVENCLLYALIP